MGTIGGLVPRTVHIYGIIFVSPGHDAAYSVLAPSVGEPAVESLVSDKATVVADAPKGAVLGNVVSIRKLALGALDTSWGSGALNFGFLRGV